MPRKGDVGRAQGLQRLLEREHAGRLVAVHAADSDHERSGGVSAIAAEQSRKEVSRGQEFSRHAPRTPRRAAPTAVP